MVSTRMARNARSLEVDQGQQHAAVTLRRHHGNVGHVPVGHRQLLSGKSAVAKGCAQLTGIGLAGPFGHGQRANALAAGELWQPSLLLRFAAGEHDGFRRQIDR